MAFTIAQSRSKRVAVMTEQGPEFVGADPLDASHLQLLDADPVTGKAKKDEEEKETVPASDPSAVLETFATAMGEMDVVVDLVTNLEHGRHIDFKILQHQQQQPSAPAGRPAGMQGGGTAAVQAMAAERLLRLGHRASVLRDCADRLKQAADGLALIAERDNAYYSQVSQLQRYWRLRRNPRELPEYAAAPLSVDFAFHDASAPGHIPWHAHGPSSSKKGPQQPARDAGPAAPTPGGSGTGPASAGAGRPQGGPAGAGASTSGDGSADGAQQGSAQALGLASGPATRVPVLRDPSTGCVRIQLDGERVALATFLNSSVKQEGAEVAAGDSDRSSPQVAVGLVPVHRTLLSRQQGLLWRLAAAAVDGDANASAKSGSNLAHSLARKAVEVMSSSSWSSDQQPLTPQEVSHAASTGSGDVEMTDAADGAPSASSLPPQPPHTNGVVKAEPGAELGNQHPVMWTSDALVLIPAQPQQHHPLDGQGHQGSATLRPQLDISLAAVRPLALEFVVQCRLPSAALSIGPPRSYTPTLLTQALLPTLSTTLSHAYFRTQLTRILDKEAHQLSQISLHWTQTSRPTTSAFTALVKPHRQYLILAQDTSVEIEGCVRGDDETTASRWARDAHNSLSRQELPRLIRGILVPSSDRTL